MFIALIPLVSAIATELHRRHATVIKTSILRSYGTVRAACIDMIEADGKAVTPERLASYEAMFSKELSGERTLRFAPLTKLNVSFWRWYPVGLCNEFGLPREVRRASIMALESLTRKRMAVAGLRPQKRSAF